MHAVHLGFSFAKNMLKPPCWSVFSGDVAKCEEVQGVKGLLHDAI